MAKFKCLKSVPWTDQKTRKRRLHLPGEIIEIDLTKEKGQIALKPLVRHNAVEPCAFSGEGFETVDLSASAVADRLAAIAAAAAVAAEEAAAAAEKAATAAEEALVVAAREAAVIVAEEAEVIAAADEADARAEKASKAKPPKGKAKP